MKLDLEARRRHHSWLKNHLDLVDLLVYFDIELFVLSVVLVFLLLSAEEF